jgi:hypothetical protein
MRLDRICTAVEAILPELQLAMSAIDAEMENGLELTKAKAQLNAKKPALPRAHMPKTPELH